MQPRINLCSVCHSQMPAGQAYCKNCGTTLCPHCREPLPQRSRFCPNCGFLCVAEQQIITSPASPFTSPGPQAMAVPRPSIATPRQPPAQSPLPPQPFGSPAAQQQRNCPRCGSSDYELGRCTGCGLLYGVGQRGVQQPSAPATPIPRPATSWPQSSIRQQPPAAYNVVPPAPVSTGQHPNYVSAGITPQSGMLMPVPRATPAAFGTMPSSAPAPPRPYSYNAEPLAPIEQRAKAPSKGGLSGFATTIIIIMVCLLVGGGIYYFMNRTGTAPTVNSAVDNSRLSIQDVTVQSTTETGATITWKTDKPASSQVIIRDSSGTIVTKSEPQETTGTAHSVAVSGLKPNTTYFYTSVSKDVNGIETTYEGKLTTASATTAVVAADKTAPKISGVNVSQITKSGAIVTWATDEPATSRVKYTTVNGNTSITPVNDNLTTTHSVTLIQLDSDTAYNYSVISVDAAGNEANLSAPQIFTTLSPIQLGAKEGNRAPDFSLKDLNGRTRKLSAFSGQIVMINFWALWCAPCIDELPYVQAVSDNLTHGQVAVLAIAASTDEQLSAVEEFIRDNQYTFPVMFDSQGVNDLYHVSTLPTTFFIDKEGIIRKVQVGSFQNQAAIESILNSLQ